MQLGAFSVSLSMADLAASRAFYEKLGFSVTGGDGTTYHIMVNGSTIIGLFHGMFEGNILTFNLGLEQDTSRSESFTDVRASKLRSRRTASCRGRPTLPTPRKGRRTSWSSTQTGTRS